MKTPTKEEIEHIGKNMPTWGCEFGGECVPAPEVIEKIVTEWEKIRPGGKMRDARIVKGKLMELYFIRKAIQRGAIVNGIVETRQIDQLTAINNQIMTLQWVLGIKGGGRNGNVS